MATRQPRARSLAAPGDDGGLTADSAMPTGAMIEFEDDELPAQTATDRVFSLLSEVTNDDRAKVVIYRKLPNTTKQSWCDEVTPADFEAGGIKMLRERFGPGDYSIYLYGMVNGAFRIRTKADISVVVETKATVAPVADTSGIAALITQMADGQRAMLEAITKRRDPMEEMKGTLALMTTMREAFGMTAPAAPQKSSIAEMVDAIKELRAAGELVNPQEADDSLVGMVKSMLPMVSQAMQMRQDAAPPVSPFPPIGPGEPIGAANDPGDVVALPPATPGANDMPLMSPEMATALKLKAYVAALVAMAIANTDPEVGAELIYEKLPDELIDVLELPNWWPLFCQQAPAVAPYEAWFTAVRHRALEMFTEEEAGDTQSQVHEAGAPGAVNGSK